MRIPSGVALSILLILASPAQAGFGEGPFQAVNLPVSGTPYEGAAEPTIGIPWNTDSVFFHEGATTWRAVFDGDTPTWTEVTPQTQPSQNLDPMLHTDPDTGRTWAGGLHGGCSIMMMSDDDGETWVPSGNMCSGADFDHQSIGSGPAFGAPVGGPDAPAEHHAFYCGQGGGGTISCTRSTDGGQTWALYTQDQTDCGGFHGHIRVSRVTGTMAVPVPDCGGEMSMLMMVPPVESAFMAPGTSPPLVKRSIPDSEEWTNGFDPSLQFTRDSGWLYYGHASENGIHIALSKDEGQSWEALGQGMGVNASHYLDIGQFHDPPILAGTFADVQAGDDDRVAFSFIGLEATGDPDIDDALRTNHIYRCDNYGDESTNVFGQTSISPMRLNQSDLVWNYYLARSYDAGQTWDVQRISEDPVQVGGVYDSVVGGGGGCRNLLDFNDMDIDSSGRVHIGYADGCIRECAATAQPDTDGYRASQEQLFRQVSGNGLFAAYDVTPPPSFAPETPDQDGDGIPDSEDDDIDGDGILNEDDEDPLAFTEKETPAAGAVLGLAALGAAFTLRRRV